MRREIRKQIKAVYEMTPPLHKEEFVREWKRPQMRMREVLYSQAAYIRKWVWVVSAVIFVAAVSGVVTASKNLVWMLSALTPFLAVTVVTESGRSKQYEMAELEMATRFSLRSVLFARMGILGVENLLLLCFLLAAGIGNGALEAVETGIYILMPYLFTTFTGLLIVRRLKSHEAVYGCMGIAVAAASFVLFSKEMLMWIYQMYSPIWWAGIMLVFTGGIIRQYKKMIIGTEELV